MKLYATVALERHSAFILFRYLDEDERLVSHTPEIKIPADSYEHARFTVDMFNKRGWK